MLQVIGFSSSQVIPADPEVIIQCSRNTSKCDHALCCYPRKATGDERFFDVHDRFAAGDSLDGDDDFYEFFNSYEFSIEVYGGLVQSYFERENSRSPQERLKHKKQTSGKIFQTLLRF